MTSGEIAGIVIGIIALILLIVLIALVLLKLKNNKSISENGNGEVIKEQINGIKDLSNTKFENLNKTIDSVQQEIKEFKEKNSNADEGFLKNLTKFNSDLENLKQRDNEFNDKFESQRKVLNDNFNKFYESLATINKSTESLSDINFKVTELNNVFNNSNKKRGTLGEYLLNKLLNDIYGFSNDLWQAQYKMPDGNIIDALVKTGKDNENIAIDSKFPWNNYNAYVDAEDPETAERYLKQFRSDVRNKVDEVSKYINKKNNISNAIMFIPSEQVFSFIYDKFQDDIVNYALNKKVWITSPTTLAALISLIDRQNSDIKLDKNLQNIKEQLLKLKEEFNRFTTRWTDIKKAQEKVADAIKDLDITAGKIESNYTKIYDQSELDAVDNVDKED